MKPLEKLLLSAALLSLVFTGNGQSIELMVTPSTQVVEIGQTDKITITAKGIGGFKEQIFLKVNAADLPNANKEFTTDLISFPYTEEAVLSISLNGATEERYLPHNS